MFLEPVNSSLRTIFLKLIELVPDDRFCKFFIFFDKPAADVIDEFLKDMIKGFVINELRRLIDTPLP